MSLDTRLLNALNTIMFQLSYLKCKLMFHVTQDYHIFRVKQTRG